MSKGRIIGYVIAANRLATHLVGPALVDHDTSGTYVCWGDYGHVFSSRRQARRLIDKSNEYRRSRDWDETDVDIIAVRAYPGKPKRGGK